MKTDKCWMVLWAMLAGLALAGCQPAAEHTEPSASRKVEFYCANDTVTVSFPNDEQLLLSHHGQQYQLARQVSASGAHYKTEDQTKPLTEFWNKGHEALVLIEGERLPTCVEKNFLPNALVARGQEPFWRVDKSLVELHWQTPDDSRRFPLIDSQRRSIEPLRWTYAAGNDQRAGNERIELEITQQLCQDTMSGQWFPYRAQFNYQQQQYQGCAGETDELLLGTHWIPEATADDSNSEAWLQFTLDGRVTGNAGCNAFRGRYKVQGQTLSIGPLIATRKDCPEAVMTAEQGFLKRLESTQKMNFSDYGKLVLSDGRGHQLRLVSEAAE
ncbi:META domain-containing protein [Idiomarina tyrosinivorans]|uniref:META domain-containing protein n=1 Tax=Idiomarina tyrosinivorans TaxID=1445662 RepID=UPI0018E4EF8C|nr:META domain-containing protein [Idiomarina tyrosinivorans]